MKAIPSFLKKYFWDIRFKDLNLDGHESYIAERILEYGDPKALSWLLRNVKKKTIKKFLLEKELYLLKVLISGLFILVFLAIKFHV